MSKSQPRATRTPYLFLRGRMYYFRAMLPPLAKGINRREICLSLKTFDLQTAKVLAQRMGLDMAEMIKGEMDLANEAVRIRLRDLARTYFKGELEKANEMHLLLSTNAEERQLEVEEAKADLTALRANPTPSPHLQHLAKRLLNESLPDAATDTLLRNHFSHLLLRAKMECLRLYTAKMTGNFTEATIKDEVFVGISPDAMLPNPQFHPVTGRLSYPTTDSVQAQPETYQAAVESFLTHKRLRNKNPKSVADVALILKIVPLLVPEVASIRDLSKSRLHDFETRVANLPSNYSKLKDFSSMTYSQIVDAGKDKPKLKPASYDKYCITLRGFMKWCMQTEKLPYSVLGDYEQTDKQDPSQKKRPFTDKELETFFHSPQYTGHKPDQEYKFRHRTGNVIVKDTRYWAPLVALYSGMRMGEILQLHVADIKNEDGVDYFDVTELAEDNSEEAKRLKNISSRRRVPIHSKLVQLGFMAFVQAARDGKHRRVFHDIPIAPDGTYSTHYSKEFGRYRKNIGLSDPMTTFHSFRHGFINQAFNQGEVNEHLLKALVGHTETSVTFAVYVKKAKMPGLKLAIEQIKYPDTITDRITANLFSKRKSSPRE